MLTIGQLADYVGVTVRAIRHYHQRGLLPEPERDSSGYRRYDAAVIDLIRIKALADAGVPLARIKEVLSAGPGEFSQAIAQIDEALSTGSRYPARPAPGPGPSGPRCRTPSSSVSTALITRRLTGIPPMLGWGRSPMP